MGSFLIKQIENQAQRNAFYNEIFDDLEVFDQLLEEGIIDTGDNMVGIEQELCLIDDLGEPKKMALSLLDVIKDKHYTNELALFNMEINLDPMPLTGSGLDDIAQQLYLLLENGREKARALDTEIFMTGILPTISLSDLTFSSMTPVERYQVLSRELLSLRGEKFEIFLQGVDDLHLKLDSILFEACNTSIQVHLQINPAKFVKYYNWSQFISGPVLACCTNSPLLFGKELWSENRIALFKQSLDTRVQYSHYREKIPRVYFGEDWLQKSPTELWKKDVARFPLIFRGEGFANSKEQKKDGLMPELRSVRLHNGTTYTWNRLCYGVDEGKSHIRIECRYLPAGPTVKDEIANMVFWVGLMKSAENQRDNFWNDINFLSVKSNFYKAARHGLQSEFNIFGKNTGAAELCLDILLPMAEKGLRDNNVDEKVISTYLGVIQNRVARRQTGASWQVENFRRLQKKFKPALVSKILVTEALQYQKKDIPVYEWENIQDDRLSVFFESSFKKLTAKDVMSHKIQPVSENATVLFAEKIMEWQKIHHLIVEDRKEMFKGIVFLSKLKEVSDKNQKIGRFATRHCPRVCPETSLVTIQDLFKENENIAVVVLEEGKTVGIITDHDI